MNASAPVFKRKRTMRTLFARLMSLASSRQFSSPLAGNDVDRIHGLPHELSDEIDINGSPVTIAPADWFVCFVPGLKRQWWHRFANDNHKHVFALRMVEDDKWLLVEPWWTRLMVNVLSLDEAIKFLRWGAAGNILKIRERIPGNGNQVRGWANCTVLVSFLLGRSYWTWTPHGLYKRLAADPDASPVDLSQFLREHFADITRRNADRALQSPKLESLPIQEVLTHIGTGVMNATMSPAAISLYKAAISESLRFKSAADAFLTLGPRRAVDRICELLELANDRGEVEIDDCANAASQFVSMLQGNMHQELIFGLRDSPSPAEVHFHVLSAVTVFLRGAGIRTPGLQVPRVPLHLRKAGPYKASGPQLTGGFPA